jgi:hypothetical protein
MVKRLLVFFVFLASATFFRFTYLPKNLLMLLSFASLILMVVTVIFFIVYDKKIRFKQNFNVEIILLLTSLFLAMFGAKWGHNQSFPLTLWAQYLMFFYVCYFFLHALRIRPQDLEQMMIIMGFLFMFLFVVQYVLYPTVLFGARVQEARGTIRIFIPGSAFAGLMFFYFLQKALTQGKIQYLPFCFAVILIPILQGTRSSIVTILFGAIIYIVFSKRVRSKIVIMLLLVAGGAMIFYLFQDIFLTLIEVTQEQSSQETEDIRIRSAKFYLYEFPPTRLNYLIGNGQSHMASPYGMRVWFYKEFYGFYLNDLGMIGEFTKYGVLFVISVFLILKKLFTIKVETRYSYIKYWAVLLVTNELLGGIFSNPTAIVVISVIMYIFDVSNFELQQPKEDKTLIIT